MRAACSIILLLLLALGCASRKPRVTDPQEEFFQAAAEGDLATIEKEIQTGGVNRKSRHGYTALMAASERGQKLVVERLLKANADVHALNQFGWDALMLAAVNGHQDVVRLLIAAGANVRYRSPSGETALLLAERGNHSEVVRILREAGAR